MSKQVNLIPDRAASFVIHPTPGIGDATTIADGIALIVGAGTGGGELFLREGTYSLTATVTLPDLPINIKGCGASTIISLGANVIAAFTIPNGLTDFRQYVFEDFDVLGTSVANQRILSVQDTHARGMVNMSKVKSTGVQIAIDITAGDTTFINMVQIVTEDCWFFPIAANTSAILNMPASTFGLEWKADRIRFIDVDFGSLGGSLVQYASPGVFPDVEAWIVDSIFNIALDSTFGTLYMENSSVFNVDPTTLRFIYAVGSITFLGKSSLVNVIGWFNISFNFNEQANVVGGEYIDCILSLFGTNNGGSVTGAQMHLGPESLAVIDTASKSLLIEGCSFVQDSAVTGARYIILTVADPGAEYVLGCTFEALSAGSNSAISINVVAGTRSAVIAGCYFNQPNVPPWIEILGTDGVIYANNFFTSTTVAPTIVGTNSRVDGVQAGDARGTGSIAFGWGRLTSLFTDAGNVNGGTTDLQSYTIPANTLNKNGRTIRVKAWGRTANNANAKTLTLEFGGQTLMTQALTASIAGTWRIDCEIVKNGGSTQRIFAELLQLVTLVQKQTATAGTQTDTAGIIIKCTGTGTANNDIVQEGFIIEVS